MIQLEIYQSILNIISIDLSYLLSKGMGLQESLKQAFYEKYEGK